jgi:hypothetical protein
MRRTAARMGPRAWTEVLSSASPQPAGRSPGWEHLLFTIAAGKMGDIWVPGDMHGVEQQLGVAASAAF